MNKLFSYLNTKDILSESLIDSVCVFLTDQRIAASILFSKFKLHSLFSCDLILIQQCSTNISRKILSANMNTRQNIDKTFMKKTSNFHDFLELFGLKI